MLSNFPPPKFIIDIIDNYTINNIVSWSKELFIFFIQPKKFFINFNNKIKDEQLKQLIYYIILNLIIVFIVADYTKINEPIKTFFSILFFSFPFLITNSLIFFILSKKTFSLWKIVSFLLLTLTILTIPMIIFMKIFIDNENYSFYFLSNLCAVIMLLYMLFLIWHILLQSTLKIFLGYTLNILFLNLLVFFIGFIFQDSYSKDSSLDPIVNEFNSIGSKIKNVNGKPYSYIERVNILEDGIQKEISYNVNGKIEYYDITDIAFIKNTLLQNVNYIDSTIPTLTFERNKSAYSDLSKYFGLMNSYFDNTPCDTCLQRYQIINRDIDSTIIDIKLEYIIDSTYLLPLVSFENKTNEIIRLNEYAASPFIIYNFIFKPIKLCRSFLGFDNSTKVVYISL